MSSSENDEYDILKNNAETDNNEKDDSEQVNLLKGNDDIDEDSLNNFPSSNDYVDESSKEWQMPIYINFQNVASIEKLIPPLMEEVDFSQCQPTPKRKPTKKMECVSKLRESNFLHDIDSENEQSADNSNDDIIATNSSNALIELPPPLEIGMEMPSVPELDIFDLFGFQVPHMPNPSDGDSKYIQEIDSRFDLVKLLQEVKSH